ncbi:hypothetical protein NPIL_407361 [Nephila pilipes]|uniref:Uncharacterized protein n=1 Tax=Nephila pilipes TaxID=299642 RepID=A0A8X6QU78_NEPPI|nr:hypothetical protein NPIL_407361 [Nephila pilipes]
MYSTDSEFEAFHNEDPERRDVYGYLEILHDDPAQQTAGYPGLLVDGELYLQQLVMYYSTEFPPENSRN